MQTSYNLYHPAGFPGLIFDLTPKHIDSYANGEASASVPFGIGVKQGATQGAFLLPTAAGEKLLGVLVSAHHYAADAALTGTLAILPKDVANVMKVGRIWVTVEQAVVPGDPVFWRHTANGAGKLVGQFRKDIDTDKAIDVSTSCRWLMNSVTANDGRLIAVLDMNLP